MWVSDGGQQRLFAYDLAARDCLDDREIELAEGNSDARGIWSDGQPMWVLDGRAKSLFAYDLANCVAIALDLGQLIGLRPGHPEGDLVPAYDTPTDYLPRCAAGLRARGERAACGRTRRAW